MAVNWIRAGLGLATVFCAAGCFGNKDKDVAAAPPPPAAAYPDSSAVLSGAPAGTPSAPSPAAVAATNRSYAPQAPVPFQLREGEQLVPHQIQPGENLSTIASKYNTSVGRIQSANGMTDTRIFAGKTLQVPTSAPPTDLAQNATAMAGASAGSPLSGATGGAYPGTMAPPSAPVIPPAPSAPSYPAVSRGEGAIAAPPVPPGSPAAPPGYPSSTSYQRTAPAPAVPSFEGSRVQFSN